MYPNFERCQKWSRVRAILRPHLPVTPRMMARIGGNSSEKEMFENCSNLPRLEVVDIFTCRGRNFWTWSPFFYEILWGSILFLSKSWHILCGWSCWWRSVDSFRFAGKHVVLAVKAVKSNSFCLVPFWSFPMFHHVPSCSIQAGRVYREYSHPRVPSWTQWGWNMCGTGHMKARGPFLRILRC